jgi:hypothetical protein
MIDLIKKMLIRRIDLFTTVLIALLVGCTTTSRQTLSSSTETNVQERLIALHHLDAPWRPFRREFREQLPPLDKSKRAFCESNIKNTTFHI